jgi:endo-1,4-beta-D-glucanase Y
VTPDEEYALIIHAAYDARTNARMMLQEVPVYVLSWTQRELVRRKVSRESGWSPWGYSEEVPPPMVGDDPDLLFGTPVLYASERWKCPDNLTDLRGVGK